MEIFKEVFIPIFQTLHDYVKSNIIGVNLERVSEQKKNENSLILMMVKNLCILVQIKEVFNNMNENLVQKLSYENMMQNDQLEIKFILEKLKF